MIKKLLGGLVVLGGVCAAHAGDFALSVSNVSAMVLGAPSREATAFAASTAYAQGERVKSSAGNVIFFATAAGTSGSTNPVGPVDFWDGGVTWRPCLRSARTGLVVVNAGAGNVFVSWVGSNAATNRSLLLVPNGAIAISGPETPQGAVYAVSMTGQTNSVRTVEWAE